MPPRHSRKKKAARKPLTIVIDGAGLSVDAVIENADLSDVLANAIRRVTGQAPQPATAPGLNPEHDFDVVKRVIEHADPKVLSAIITLAQERIGHTPGPTTPVS